VAYVLVDADVDPATAQAAAQAALQAIDKTLAKGH
jgi:hypothetical protein